MTIDPIPDWLRTLSHEAREKLEQSILDSLGTARDSSPKIRPDRIPLASSQKGLWFLQKSRPSDASYNMYRALVVEGRLEIDAMNCSLRQLLQRHEILRTAFPVDIDGPHQTILTDLVAEVDGVHNAQRLCREEDWVRDDAEQLIRTPFNLECPPLFRARIYHIDDERSVLLIIMHHIISDAWSMSTFLDELSNFYCAYCFNGSAQFEEAPQYADFVLKEQELERTLGAQGLAYWRKTLSGAPAALSLPSRNVFPKNRSEGQQFSNTLDRELSNELKHAAQQLGVTRFILSLAAFSVLVSRYCGMLELVIGTVVSNRDAANRNSLLGLVAKTLPLRVRIDETMTFAAFVETVKHLVVDALAHGHLPLEKMFDERWSQYAAQGKPIFQAVFAYQNSTTTGTFGGYPAAEFECNAKLAKFDLWWGIRNEDIGLRVGVQYRTGLLDQMCVAAMASDYAALLWQALRNLYSPIKELALSSNLSAKPREIISSVDAHITLHSLFEREVRQHPEAVAVTFGSSQLTFRALEERANKFANYLRAAGFSSGEIIALCLDRSLELIVAIIGTLKAGCAYLPIDPSYPPEYVRSVLADACASLLWINQGANEIIAPRGGKILTIERCWPTIMECSSYAPKVAVGSADLAYVIYTSGSTGLPKGVAVEHKQVIALFEAAETSFQFMKGDVWALCHSFAFDFSVWEMWGSLLHGGTLIMFPDWIMRSPTDYYDLLVEAGVSVLAQVPSSFARLDAVDEVRAAGERLDLRVIVLAGERLDFRKLRGWLSRRMPLHPRIINMYGTTETTVHATFYEIPAAFADDASVIGQPLPHLEAQVIDEHGRVTPLGGIGELYLSGKGLARGYLNRPELTAECFILGNRDTHFAEPRIYRTGDLARVEGKCKLAYVGRVDRQIKINGFRIEPGEIEHQLLGYPGIKAAAVCSASGYADSMILSAFVVLFDGMSLRENDIRGFLVERLPLFMLPHQIIRIAALPLMRNGKIDYKVLAAQAHEVRGNPERKRANSTLELQMITIWEAVLGIQGVDPDSNFFSLGGDSVSAVAVAARATACGMGATVAALFRYPTVRELCLAIAMQ